MQKFTVWDVYLELEKIIFDCFLGDKMKTTKQQLHYFDYGLVCL